jgi:TPR repeat protein
MAINIFLNLASEGYPEALYMLGRCYDKCGDPVEATKWMLLAANKGLKEAEFDVAIAYEMGKGVPQDYEEAAKWYRKAAAQGVKEAQDNLNELINEGKIKGGASSTSSYTPPPTARSVYHGKWVNRDKETLVTITDDGFVKVTGSKTFRFTVTKWEAITNTSNSFSDYPSGYKLEGYGNDTPWKAMQVYIHKNGQSIVFGYGSGGSLDQTVLSRN